MSNANERIISVYIIPPISPSGKVGGAEKRFAELWSCLARRFAERQGPGPHFRPKLVVTQKMRDTLQGGGLPLGQPSFASDVVVVEEAELGPLAHGRLCSKLDARDPGCLFHCVMFGLWARPRLSRRSITSVTAARVTRVNFNTVGYAFLMAALLASPVIDVLNAEARDTMVSWLPWKRRAFSVTPNTCVDMTRYLPRPFAERRKTAIFLATFLDKKQVFRLIAKLPAIQALMVERGIEDIEYLFLGRDGEPRSAEAEIKSLREEKGMNVRAYFAPTPQEELSRTKVYFSIQHDDNYPSKSLAEAIACGAMPIITDVGRSREMAEPEFATFIPRDFEAVHVADAMTKVFSLTETEYDAKVATARAFVARKFSVETMADYFVGLYRKLL